MNFNPRMRFVWIAQAFIAVQLLFLWALLIYALLPLESELVEGIPNRMLILGSVIVFSLLLLISVAIGAEIYHKTFEYEFKEDAFVVRRGIISKKEISFPYKEIQSAKVLRHGVHMLDQAFGLACIHVKAGSKFVVVPGIAEPEAFLRRLMANVEGNDKVKGSELYMSEREILLKLAADVRELHAKVEEVLAEQKAHKQQHEAHAKEREEDYFRKVEMDIDRLIRKKDEYRHEDVAPKPKRRK